MLLQRWITRVAALTALPLALTMPGCDSPTEPVEGPVAEFHARWRAQGITNYRYTFQASCFCLDEWVRPVAIEVRGGQPVSVRYADTGQPADRTWFAPYDTIDELFAVIEEGYRHAPHDMFVTYDPALGYPRVAQIHPSQRPVDGGLDFTVSAFQPR